MSADRPYSRVYWEVLHDKKFDAIRADMRHFGSWTLMLVVAEMAYPAPAFIPPHVPKASQAALVDAGLIELLPARMYRLKGLRKEREERAERARASANVRWDRNATALPPDSERNANGLLAKTSKDETSKGKQETSNAREDAPFSAGETDLFAFIAQHGAFIRPESGFGVRLLGLVERRGAEAVLEMARTLAAADDSMSDRQWVFGLEKALDAIPSPPMDEMLPVESPDEAKSKRIYERMMAQRLDYYRNSGVWPEEWGELPAEASAA